jgi:hypothetical protein
MLTGSLYMTAKVDGAGTAGGHWLGPKGRRTGPGGGVRGRPTSAVDHVPTHRSVPVCANIAEMMMNRQRAIRITRMISLTVAKSKCKVDVFVLNNQNLQEEKRRMRRRIQAISAIFIVILLGLAIIFITSASPMLASMASASPAPSLSVQAGKASGPCGDKSKRYADCGNGTVTDTQTGLIWLKKVDCFPASNFDDAKKAVGGLKNGDCGLTDGSKPGDWRLPTDKEWEATMTKAKDLQCTGPVLTNDAGTGCIKAGPSSFGDVDADYYWSSTQEGTGPVAFGDIDHGNILHGNPTNSLRVWPVRGGK